MHPIPKVQGLGNNIKACRAVYELERERKHIRSIWSRVTCLVLPLAAAQSLERRAPEDSRSRRRQTIATGNKQLQTNK
jgi:hypothetical protein